MSALICVCGTPTSGKTLLILGMLQLAQRWGLRVGACKPVDVGKMEYQSTDQPGDGESFQLVGQMTEHISLINPYLLHERLPPVLAARREGIRIDLNLLNNRLDLLRKRYTSVLLEGPSGLRIPFTESETWLGLLSHWHPEVIWVSDIGEDALEGTLLSVETLRAAGLQVKILLNNINHHRDAELIQYHWMVLEEKLLTTVLGLIPFLENGNKVEKIADILASIFNESWLSQSSS